jgi:DNA-binding FadR family transcriptional regulator
MADFMDQNDQALSKVREFIERQNIALDGRIPPERTLASELGVGRRSVRRALDVLEQEGRIHRHQGRGTFVDIRATASLAAPNSGASGNARPALSAALENVLDYTNPLEVIEVRLANEPVMARLAALRASPTEIKRLTMLAGKTRTASDAEAYERADSLFHRTIAEASRNTLFLAFFDTMRATARKRTCRCSATWATCSSTFTSRRFRARTPRSRPARVALARARSRSAACRRMAAAVGDWFARARASILSALILPNQ